MFRKKMATENNGTTDLDLFVDIITKSSYNSFTATFSNLKYDKNKQQYFSSDRHYMYDPSNNTVHYFNTHLKEWLWVNSDVISVKKYELTKHLDNNLLSKSSLS